MKDIKASQVELWAINIYIWLKMTGFARTPPNAVGRGADGLFAIADQMMEAVGKSPLAK